MPSLLKKLIIQTKFFQQLRYWVHQSKSQKKSDSCRRRFDWKTIINNPCIKILIVQEFQKVDTKFDSSGLSKRCFSVITVLISFMRFTINNLTLTEKDSFHFSIFCFFWIKIWTLPGIDFFIPLILSIFNLVFLYN